MGIFKPIWKEFIMFDKKKEEKANEYIRRMIARDDQKELIAIATEAPDAELRRFAVAYVRNTEILKMIACQDSSEEVRSMAIHKLDDETFFVAYAIQTDNRSLALHCIEKIKSQDGLAVIVANTNSEYKIKACLKRISQTPPQNIICTLDKNKSKPVQDFLALHRSSEDRNRMVFSEPDAAVREKIIRSLTDYKVLYRCATEDKSGNCRITAYKKLLEMKFTISAEWWKKHIDENTDDQLLAI